MKLSKIYYKLLYLSTTGRNGLLLNSFSFKRYMHRKQKSLSKLGVTINGSLTYVHPTVYFDGHDYSLITIGNGVTISREVMFLTHDYSLATAMKACDLSYAEKGKNVPHSTATITIGDYCFIGARASILPGTKIGRGSIIGACSVVKGSIPDYSIVVGNPAKIIKSTKDYVKEGR